MNASCQCKLVSFRTPLPKPLALYICHCDECRHQSSSAYGCSAIFPYFPLPCKEFLSCYTRPTASGHTLNCYFCKNCGTRVIHTTPGKDVVSVKGGCIEGLDWGSARHIWCKRAMVPIPEGVERDEEEPEDGPKDRDGGVGGASRNRWHGNAGVKGDGECGTVGSRWRAELFGNGGANARVEMSGGLGKEEEERPISPMTAEKEIREMTRRFETTQWARKVSSDSALGMKTDLH